MKFTMGEHELELMKRPRRKALRATLDAALGAAELGAGIGLAVALAPHYREIAELMHQPGTNAMAAIGAASPALLIADGLRRMGNYDFEYRRHTTYGPSPA